MRIRNLIIITAVCLFVATGSYAQRTLGGHELQLDNGNGKTVTILPPAGLLNSYIWTLPLNPPPTNSAFSEAGTITGQVLRWDNTLGYWVASSAVSILPNGNIAVGNASTNATLTIEPGSGGNVLMNNIANDNATLNFLTIDGSNRVRYRTLNSFLGVNANEGLVYEVPNIKLGAADVFTNPFAVNRFINLNNKTLTYTYNNGASTLLMLQGNNGNIGVGTTPNTFKVEVAGNIGPSVNNTHSLGSNTVRWKDVFVGPSSVHIGNGTGDQTTLSYTNVSSVKKFNVDADDNGGVDAWIDGSGNLEFNGALKPNNTSGNSGEYLQSSGAGTPVWVNIQSSAWSKTGNSGIDTLVNFVGTTDNEDIYFRTKNVKRARFRNSTGDQDSGAFEPYLSNIYNLGTASHRWHDAYFGPASLHIGGFISGSHGGGQDPQSVDEATISYSNGSLIIDKPLGSTGSMVPNNSDLFTLGSNTNRWADLYLGGSSLHIGSSTVEGTISYDTTNQILKFNTNGIGPAEITMAANGNVTISSLTAGGLVKADPATGLLSIASGGADFEAPLTFTNGLTRTVNTVALGGALTATTTITTASSKDFVIAGAGNIQFSALTGGIIKTNGSGVLSIAASGTDYEPALTFNNGLTRTSNTITLGGALTASTTITTASGKDLIVAGGGNIQFSSLTGGLLKTNGSGVLSIATSGTDYESPLTFNNGLTRTASTIKLGGTLTAATDIPLAGFDLTLSGSSGNVAIGQTSTAARLDVKSSTSTTGIKSLASGSAAGKAADFSSDNSSNASNVVSISGAGSADALSVSTSGGGYAASFTGTGSSKGISVTAVAGQTGVIVNTGSVILSHTNATAATSQTFGGGGNAVVAIDNGSSGAISITLSAGTNGQILYIFNGDGTNTATITAGLHTSNTGPVAIAPGKTLECIYVTNGTGSGWVTR
jgi:hypothetical protein